ncbi:MAG: AAA family ATPase, partial [Streptosporangiales bacterium]
MAASRTQENHHAERSGGDPVLTEERDELRRSREFLHLMREDVLSLHAMGGDPVSEEYLKAELYHRAEALKDIPDTPLFFGRLDYAEQSATGNYGTEISGTGQSGDTAQSGDGGIAGHSFHIGRRHVHAPDGTPAVIDWRAPVSRPFYRASATDPMNLARRRRFGFSGGELTAYEDELFAGAEDSIPDRSAPVAVTRPSRILIDEIERPRSGPMRDIVATIQPDQDDIVRADAAQTVCVQGAPGTGKTAVGLHRVAYLLYAYREQVRRRGVVMVGPNQAFLSYIRNVLPALGELDVSQTTVGELVASVQVRGSDDEAAAIVK